MATRSARGWLAPPLGWSVFRNEEGDWVAVQCHYQGRRLAGMSSYMGPDGHPVTWPRRKLAVSDLLVYAMEAENQALRERLRQLEEGNGQPTLAGVH